jgi:microcystin-dependent protein
MDPFVAEIRIFPYTFAPKAWAFCRGQLLPLSQNTALFSLLGTIYGGDGKSTFALPDLTDCVPMHPGTGSGLGPKQLGQMGGSMTVSLLESEIPAHTHTLRAQGALGDASLPTANAIARTSGATPYRAPGGPTVAMAFESLSVTGGDQPHNNMQPYLSFNLCISLQGIFPQRP